MPHRLLPFKPALYHGNQSSRPYFEGWYFKFVSAKGDFPLALIPGVFRSKTIGGDMSFIQALYGKSNESRFLQFPFEAFSSDYAAFRVQIGLNLFSMDTIHLELEEDGFRLDANLRCRNALLLKTSLLSPSIMGPFSYLPGMQCNHGVLSLAHDVMGSLFLNGTAIDMDGGTGYTEKDWGEAFPESWVWVQGNGHGPQGEPVCCTCSVARIPYGPLDFRGLIAVFCIGGAQYRFATYNGSRIVHMHKRDNGIDIELRRHAHALAISARAEGFGRILAPTATGMDRDVYESLGAAMHVTLLKNGKPLFSDSLENCGLEISNAKGLIRNSKS